MKCPKCGRYAKETRISDKEGGWSIYSECSKCGRILVEERKLKTTRSFTKKVDLVKVLLTIVIVVLVGISVHINNQLNKKEETLKELQIQYLTVYNNYMTLLNTTEVLENYYDELQEMYSILRTEYTDLENRYSTLESKYSELLQEKLFIQKELDEILNFKKSIVLEDNKTVQLSASGNTSLTYEMEYAGYVRVNFSSSAEIYFWIGSSITENVYYARYPSFPNTATNGTFTVPVCCLTHIYLTNTNEEVEAIVLLSIKYIY